MAEKRKRSPEDRGEMVAKYIDDRMRPQETESDGTDTDTDDDIIAPQQDACINEQASHLEPYQYCKPCKKYVRESQFHRRSLDQNDYRCMECIRKGRRRFRIKNSFRPGDIYQSLLYRMHRRAFKSGVKCFMTRHEVCFVIEGVWGSYSTLRLFMRENPRSPSDADAECVPLSCLLLVPWHQDQPITPWNLVTIDARRGGKDEVRPSMEDQVIARWVNDRLEYIRLLYDHGGIYKPFKVEDERCTHPK